MWSCDLSKASDDRILVDEAHFYQTSSVARHRAFRDVIKTIKTGHKKSILRNYLYFEDQNAFRFHTSSVGPDHLTEEV